MKLGPYPLCEHCQQTNGGLTHVQHPQPHVEAHGYSACVDEGIADLVAELWAVAGTVGSCQDDGGLAYVSTSDTETAMSYFAARGLKPQIGRHGRVYFRTFAVGGAT